MNVSKKDIAVISLIVLIIILFGFSLVSYNSYRNYLLNPQTLPPTETPTPQQVSNAPTIGTYPPNIPPLASSTKIHASVLPDTVLSGTNAAPGIPPSQYGTKVEVIPKEEESGTAIFGDAYLNGKEIAQGVPFYSSLEGNSPEATYYAYRSHSHASAGSSYIGIEIFNLHTGEYTEIQSPPGEDVSTYIPDSFLEGWYYIMPYIESYAWENDHSINFIFYYLAWSTNERVSPREIWNYDLITKQYTLTSSQE